jgi:hypothetical protein
MMKFFVFFNPTNQTKQIISVLDRTEENRTDNFSYLTKTKKNRTDNFSYLTKPKKTEPVIWFLAGREKKPYQRKA